MIKLQALYYQEILAKIAALCHTTRSILNRCERGVLLQKDSGFFIKRLVLIWTDSRLCVLWNGWFWWKVVFERTKSYFCENKKFCERVRKSDFLHIYKPQVYSKLSADALRFSLSAVTKITCNFSFHRLLAVSSPYCNFQFSVKPDSASIP